MTFRHDSRKFKSPHSRSISPLGSPLLAVGPIMINDVHCYLITKENKRKKMMKKYTTDGILVENEKKAVSYIKL